ncbi:hypothetical protein AAFC00_005286 [Neodothiora populina]
MFGETNNSTLTILGCISVLAVTACFFCPSKVLRWVERKRYQYEVTFSLYMMTPTEKFIFNSILFLFLSMVTIAASLYLPEHITFICRRAFYYVAGDFEHSASRLSHTVIQTAVKTAAAITSSAPGTAVKEAVETVREVIGS